MNENNKTIKKKLDEYRIEKEKSALVQKLQEKQIKSLKEEYEQYLFDTAGNNESILENIKNKHYETLEQKNEELISINTELMGMKLEKERYFSEYNIIKKEYEKLLTAFKVENNKYITKYEESENNSM